MLIQPYECDLCGLKRELRIGAQDSILKVLNQIRLDHYLRSPDCKFSTDYISVEMPRSQSDEE